MRVEWGRTSRSQIVLQSSIHQSHLLLAKTQRSRPDQGKNIGTQDTIDNECPNLLFEKAEDSSFWEKNPLFDKNCWRNWIAVWQKLDRDQNVIPTQE